MHMTLYVPHIIIMPQAVACWPMLESAAGYAICVFKARVVDDQASRKHKSVLLLHATVVTH